MPFVILALVVLAGLILLNLSLTMAIVRRLRHHTEKLAALETRGGVPSGLAVGATVPPFTATTLAGDALSHEWLAGGATMVTFLSPHCQACRDKLPQLRSYCEQAVDRELRTLVVITGETEDAADMVTALQGATPLIVEPKDGQVATAFQIRGFPSFIVVGPDSTVHHSTFSLDGLPAALAAPAQ